MSDKIFTLVSGVILELSDAQPADITPEATLESLGIDSLSLAEMLFAFEDRLNVTMPEIDMKVRPEIVNDLMEIVKPYAASLPDA
jgi:acyl carrier protein